MRDLQSFLTQLFFFDNIRYIMRLGHESAFFLLKHSGAFHVAHHSHDVFVCVVYFRNNVFASSAVINLIGARLPRAVIYIR